MTIRKAGNTLNYGSSGPSLTTNMLERLNKEIRRRARVATLFPNEESLLRLASAILMETHEDWQPRSRYLNMYQEEETT